jgi:hypothetical protein
MAIMSIFAWGFCGSTYFGAIPLQRRPDRANTRRTAMTMIAINQSGMPLFFRAVVPELG